MVRFEKKVCANRPCGPCPIAGDPEAAKAVDYVLAHQPVFPFEHLSEDEKRQFVGWAVGEYGVQGAAQEVGEAVELALGGGCESRAPAI